MVMPNTVSRTVRCRPDQNEFHRLLTAAILEHLLHYGALFSVACLVRLPISSLTPEDSRAELPAAKRQQLTDAA